MKIVLVKVIAATIDDNLEDEQIDNLLKSLPKCFSIINPGDPE